MKLITLLPVILFFVFCLGCNRSNEKDRPEKEGAPAILKDESSSMSSIGSDRGGGAMVDEIYSRLVKEQPELQTFENRLEMFDKALTDSLADFKRYYSKSESYYISANGVLDKITDTLLKERLRMLLTDSQNKLMEKTKPYTALVENVDQQNKAINNYHEALKVIATLPVIENYQKKSLPGIKSIKNLSNEAGQLKDKAFKLNGQYEVKAAK